MKLNNAFVKSHHNDWLVMGVLIVVNLIIKLHHISGAPYWLDESHFVFEAQKSFRAIIDEALNYPNSPLYVVLLGFWVKLFGISELSTRFLSLLFHLLSIPLIFYLAKKHISREAALIAILLFSVSGIHLYYTHEARSYTMITFLTILSFYYFMDLMKHPDRKAWAGYTITNTLLLYTQVVPVFAIIAQFLASLFYVKKNKKGFLFFMLGNLIAGAAFSIWIFFNRYYKRDMAEAAWLSSPSVDQLFLVLVRFFNTRGVFFTFILLLVLFLVQKAKSLKTADFRILWISLLWGLVPVVCVFVLSLIIPRFLPRYMLFAAPGLYLSFAFVVSKVDYRKLFRMDPRYDSFIKVLLVILILIHSAIHLNVNPYKGEPWDKAAEYVRKNQTGNSLTLVSAWYMFRPFSYYYDVDIFRQPEKVLPLLEEKGVIFGNTAATLKKRNLNPYEKLILVQAHDKVADPEGSITQYLNEQYALIEKKKVGGISLSQYRLSDPVAVDSIFIDFESDTIRYNQLVIEDEQAWSGEHVTKVDREHEYSSGLEMPVSAVSGAGFSQVSAEVFVTYTHPATQAKLVISLENENEIYFWKSKEIFTEAKTGEWHKILFKVQIPISKVNPSDIFKVYIWNQGSTEVLADDIKVRFY